MRTGNKHGTRPRPPLQSPRYMTVHFLTTGSRLGAAARYRAWSIVDAWNSPEVTAGPVAPTDVDILVVSSLIRQEQAALTARVGIVWDFTDPLWCYWGDEVFRGLAGQMTKITVSSEGLAHELREEFEITATVIPDRMPYQAASRIHQDVAVPTLVWFGYSFNRYPALSGAAPLLRRLRQNGIPFRLRIIDDQPMMPLDPTDRYGFHAVTEYHAWNPETITSLLCSSDIALLPPFPGWIGTTKSTNRAITASWAGLPVVDGSSYRELKALLTDVDARVWAGAKQRAWAEQEGDIRTSVADWQAVIAAMVPPTPPLRPMLLGYHGRWQAVK